VNPVTLPSDKFCIVFPPRLCCPGRLLAVARVARIALSPLPGLWFLALSLGLAPLHTGPATANQLLSPLRWHCGLRLEGKGLFLLYEMRGSGFYKTIDCEALTNKSPERTKPAAPPDRTLAFIVATATNRPDFYAPVLSGHGVRLTLFPFRTSK
jgi:hypothetical protein